ncbi:L-fuculose-phosphate aldolase [Halanaerobium sp. Z-7514]|uniref:L-fuculose-phosphate aldolase n=1 Tax=Halanaerobium polyolivorans TaxID=2886943 RepID=A0AAW4X1B5_9FIRM|nr:L-fuculose-phosphate aldolase [Halanaerobium polyolivorans]MCC3145596.1 L-fuculose-phosphate aldolase [Halanaerobium polyolivorans]
MLLENERKKVVEYGKKLIESGLTKGTGGNISVYNAEKNLMAISPSGIDYFKTEPEDVVVLDLDGKVVDGKRKPSSEYPMHKIFYERREDIKAVVHAHSIYSTTISVLRWEIPALSYLIPFGGGKKIPCADYATFGTQELAEKNYKAMEGYNACLMANHGLLAGSKDIETAFMIAEQVEFIAELFYRTKAVGEPTILDDKEMELMIEKFKSYGQ